MDRSFTFFLHDDHDAPPAFEIDLFLSEAEARSHALALLAERPRYRAVEIYDGVNSIKIERPGTPTPSA